MHLQGSSVMTGSNIDRPTHSLTERSVDRLADRLTERPIGRSCDWLTDRTIHSPIDRLIVWPADSLTTANIQRIYALNTCQGSRNKNTYRYRHVLSKHVICYSHFPRACIWTLSPPQWVSKPHLRLSRAHQIDQKVHQSASTHASNFFRQLLCHQASSEGCRPQLVSKTCYHEMNFFWLHLLHFSREAMGKLYCEGFQLKKFSSVYTMLWPKTFCIFSL